MIYDIAIIGAGCAGLSLAHQISKTNQNKKVIIVDSKTEFQNDRTWSFWKTNDHDFEDCLEKQWSNFEVKNKEQIKIFNQIKYPYQTINSLKFYEKIKNNLNDKFLLKLGFQIKDIQKTSEVFQIKNSNEVIESKLVFDSRVPEIKVGNLYQHFYGLTIETNQNAFDENKLTLMDFKQKEQGVHFFYILPFKNNRALIETTWLSKLNELNKDKYVDELHQYIQNDLGINQFNIIREEIGAIPMFRRSSKNETGYVDIGIRGNINRMSTGYAFPYIQAHSKIIANALDQLSFKRPISAKYEFLDQLFVKVLKNHTNQMPDIFFRLFDQNNQESVIRFLSSEGSWLDDMKIISKMPKLLFLKNLFN